LKVNSATCWILLYGYITMHGQQNIKFRGQCSPKYLSQRVCTATTEVIQLIVNVLSLVSIPRRWNFHTENVGVK